MFVERGRQQSMPRKIGGVLGAFVLGAALVTGAAAPRPESSASTPPPIASPTETSKPIPVLKPNPTPEPTVEPTPSPTMSPTPEPTPAPTKKPSPILRLPKSGNVIWNGPRDGKTVYLTFDDCYSATDTRKAIQIAHDMGARL